MQHFVYVVYRRLNVCKIESIERNVFETNGKEYYKLVPLAKQDTEATVIYLPVEFEQGLRHILTKGANKRLFSPYGRN